ncbi:MAG: hypothetical protein A2987_04510 [Omnitrophica bacterium RIFCSPLOWO2_01_FULL_45_10]|nr:MAG: hypothetical protein A2987_04510 [Omnitrophica bacterium RIFCSPLOWO2_01_FULL_45_10]
MPTSYRYLFRILIIILVAGLIALAAILTFWKPPALNYAENRLRSALKDYSVKIGARDITARTLIFRDIDIRKTGQPVLGIGQLQLNFSIPSLIRYRIFEFFVKDIDIYSKYKINQASGRASFKKDTLILKNLSASFLGGIVKGDGRIISGKAAFYSFALTLKDIQLEKIVETFELSEKMELIGLAEGKVRLSGRGTTLTKLKGNLEVAPDGTLTIKSDEWLQKIAEYAHQDVDVIVDNFKNYRYNEGTLSLGLRGFNIVMEAHLKGDTGKRDLLVTVHDFNPGGGR